METVNELIDDDNLYGIENACDEATVDLKEIPLQRMTRVTQHVLLLALHVCKRKGSLQKI